MKRRTGSLVLGALAVLALASPARAQTTPYVFFGGGLSLPMGDFKDYAKAGWLAAAGIGANIGDKGLFVEAEGFYGSNKHKAPDDGDKTNLLIMMGAIGYSFAPAARVHPYVLAGAGFLNHKYVPATGASDSETKFAWTAAGGLVFDLGATTHFWVEARYIGHDYSSSVPVLVGFSIDLKKN